MEMSCWRLLDRYQEPHHYSRGGSSFLLKGFMMRKLAAKAYSFKGRLPTNPDLTRTDCNYDLYINTDVGMREAACSVTSLRCFHCTLDEFLEDVVDE
uniref:p0402A09.12 protein n=1 Tax=Oryza sativa subsp. japonica TaxID=39947 RepID=Q7F2F4_ORYSJ|nr:P0402A09.12 [Oryza sativa Japonica Group]BAB92131.1 P0455C04.6 [Oryza sativa Japonica Group]